MPRQSPLTRSSRRPSEVTAARTDSIELMNTALKRKFALIERSVNDLRADNLRYYHKIGKLVLEIQGDPGTYAAADGTAPLKLIERALSTQARMLRKAATFAQLYSQEQLEALIGLSNPDNKFQLNWGHVSFLLTVPTEDRRNKFANEAIEKMLDPGALHELIKKRTNRTGGHGRKHVIPRTVSAQIRQILAICKNFLGKHDNVWNGEDESVIGNLMNQPPAQVEQEQIDQLTRAIEMLGRISEGATQTAESLQRVIEHMNGVLEQRAADEAAALAGRSTRNITLPKTKKGAVTGAA